MHILADENIALAHDYFAPYGRLTLCAGRTITAAILQDVDVLLVRSVTRVDGSLLRGTPVRYVATATSGVDHVDLAYLASHNIGFAAARGCNAEGVVDYVFSALAALSVERGLSWLGQPIGIVGCGEIGSRLARRYIALGVVPKIYDPFLSMEHPLSACFVSRAEVLRQPIVTLHVPFTDSGDHPTRLMVDEAALAAMPADGVLINAARGEVLDERAVIRHCTAHPHFSVVLDAWQHEPTIDLDLLQCARYGSSHIAGYSHGGKVRGTSMIHAQFCDHFGFDPGLAAACDYRRPQALHYRDDASSLQHQLNNLILAAYDLREDDALLRASTTESDRSAAFDALRRNYALRREFSEYRVTACEEPALRAAVAGLGMALEG